jgi:hypothetical protein
LLGLLQEVTMAERSLEDRVAALEQQVASLTAAAAADANGKGWRRTFGMFAGDEVMKRILDGALAYREADRRRTRPKRLGPRSAKK